MAVSKRTPGERLAGKYTEQSNGCHEWGRARNSRGYGVIWFDGKLQLAHRLAFLARHDAKRRGTYSPTWAPERA